MDMDGNRGLAGHRPTVGFRSVRLAHRGRFDGLAAGSSTGSPQAANARPLK